MNEYRVFETAQFQNDLKLLAKGGQARVIGKLHQVVYGRLRVHPHFGPNIRRLREYDPPTWRYRIGAWRFFYEIDEAHRIVYMTAAAHRGSAY